MKIEKIEKKLKMQIQMIQEKNKKEMIKEEEKKDQKEEKKNYNHQFEVKIIEKNNLQVKCLIPDTLIHPRVEFSTITLQNGDIFIFGGYDPVTHRFIKQCEIYERTTGNLKLSIRLRSSRGKAAFLLLKNGKVLISGGFTVFGKVLKDAELFDPELQTITHIPVFMEDGRYGHSTHLLPNGLVLVAGGIDKDSKIVKKTVLFNVETFTKHQDGPEMIMKRCSHSSIALKDGRIWFTGGEENFSTTSTEFYDPKENKFFEGPDLYVPRRYHLTHLFQDGKVLVLNGLSPDSNNISEIFDPTTNTIEKFPCMFIYILKYPFII